MAGLACLFGSESQLEERLKILGGVLTPEQINAYRAQQMKQIDMMAAAMNAAVKMARPQKPARAAD